MTLKCRLCKIDFESPTYKPYCEPHALAYEKFKKAKSRASDNVSGQESVDKPVGDESTQACASVDATDKDVEGGKSTDEKVLKAKKMSSVSLSPRKDGERDD